MTRYLPPLLLVLLLGLVVLRACERPSRDSARTTIQGMWDVTTDEARKALSEEADRYLDRFQAEDDRTFVTEAQLRARFVDRAVVARWKSLDQPVAPEDARAFARLALDLLAWDDTARTRPSLQHSFCILALVEGGDQAASSMLTSWLASAPLGELYALIRRSGGLHDPKVRELLAQACRARARREARAGGEPAADWELIAAILAVRPEPYPERDADVERLVRALDGRFRTEFPPRWTMGMVALGGSGDPRAVAALRRHAEALSTAQSEQELRDLAVVSMALLAAGDWELAETVREAFLAPGEGVQLLRAFLPEILADLWNRGHDRALEVLADLWEGPAATDPGLRVQLARALLFRERAPAGRLTPQILAAAMERPDSPAPHLIVGLGYHMKAGDAAARREMLRFLAGKTAPRELDGADKVSADASAKRAATAVVSALRALYLYA